eukprot:CAMPEP_0116930350 /NCGR_PEP_ID=MMETSP0467-20121206/27145_1 /TAXON_ID=283647 /ORGANISM="Mesodinium pulex, Strain SPMC105" /LENGTH=151 /DNA_ID=CAMNT_0004610535 /DNA_START=34 /DNA_END=489 /DNA_ORIENTATION=+
MSRTSDSLVWQVIRKQNSFLHKRERTSRAGAVMFSCEPGNLLSAHSFKYSGIANSKTVDVSSEAGNRVALKTSAPTKTNLPKKAVNSTPLRKDRKRSLKAVKARGCNNFHRADLTSAAVARYNRLYRDARVKGGIVKAAKSTTGPRNNRHA